MFWIYFLSGLSGLDIKKFKLHSSFYGENVPTSPSSLVTDDGVTSENIWQIKIYASNIQAEIEKLFEISSWTFEHFFNTLAGLESLDSSKFFQACSKHFNSLPIIPVLALTETSQDFSKLV